jgi:ABC-type transporter Mla subunit MlaD
MPSGGRIVVARTTSPIDADDLLSALDGDTREFLKVLLSEGGRATKGRGGDLRALSKALGPTAGQLRGVSRTLAARQAELQRLVTNLAAISGAVGSRDAELAGLVTAARQTVGELASQSDALDAGLRELPVTLQAVRGTLEAHRAVRPGDRLGFAGPAAVVDALPRHCAPPARWPGTRARSCARRCGRSRATLSPRCGSCGRRPRGSRRSCPR